MLAISSFRYSSAKYQAGILNLFEKVGNNYQADQKLQFIIDLLSIPELLTGDTEEDLCVQNDFEKYIKSFIRQFTKLETLLLNISTMKTKVIPSAYIKCYLLLYLDCCLYDWTHFINFKIASMCKSQNYNKVN